MSSNGGIIIEDDDPFRDDDGKKMLRKYGGLVSDVTKLCTYCGLNADQTKILEYHSTCEECSVSCSNGCGMKNLSPSDISNHLRTCPLQLVTCSFCELFDNCDINECIQGQVLRNAVYEISRHPRNLLNALEKMNMKSEEDDLEIHTLREQLEDIKEHYTLQIFVMTSKIQIPNLFTNLGTQFLQIQIQSFENRFVFDIKSISSALTVIKNFHDSCKSNTTWLTTRVQNHESKSDDEKCDGQNKFALAEIIFELEEIVKINNENRNRISELNMKFVSLSRINESKYRDFNKISRC